MIYEVEGDILLTRAKVIAQEVTSNDLMTTGLSRKLAETCPGMPVEFRSWCQSNSPEAGDIWFWSGRQGSRNKYGVVNLIATEGGSNQTSGRGRPSKINLIRNLRELNKLAKTQRWDSIALPKLGCGAGGLDWYEVRGMIHSQLGELLIPIYVYVGGRDGQLAFEPGK